MINSYLLSGAWQRRQAAEHHPCCGRKGAMHAHCTTGQGSCRAVRRFPWNVAMRCCCLWPRWHAEPGCHPVLP